MKIKTLTLLLTLSIGAFSQNNSSWKSENLSGKVESFSLDKWAITVEDGVLMKDSIESNWTCYYNEKGNETMSENYWQFGRFALTTSFTYDMKDRMVVEEAADQEDHVWKRQSFKYSHDGKTAVKEDFDGRNTQVAVCTINWLGKIGKIEMFDEKEKLKSRESYQYDGDGNLISQMIRAFTPDTSFNVAEMQYKYDTKSNLVEEIYITKDTVQVYKTSYVYDDKGNCIQTEKKENGAKPVKILFQYKFDDKGNWIEKVSYQNESIVGLEERSIEYY